MKKLFTLLLCSLPFSILSAQSLEMRWHLVQNDMEPGVVENQLTIRNLTADTLTADGSWLIGYCWMSVHPYPQDGDQLIETEVCATYHTLRPTPDFLPLAPEEERTFTLLQKGAIIRESGGPQGAFFVAQEGAQPVDIPIFNDKFTDPLQWTRDNNPGYADGEWIYAYNQPFCKMLPSSEDIDGSTADWYRRLNIVPMPKQVEWLKGKANFSAPITRKNNKKVVEDGYVLTISEKKIIIEASNETGFFYGEQTVARLRENRESLPGLRITDYPDMGHRGLMLDIARNYTPKDEVLRLLDAMAAYKLNVLHFHLVDDEAWRVEIEGLPELTEVGARRGFTINEDSCLYPAYCGGWNAEDTATTANGFLTRQDYIDIVSHADSLHIRVIPEIDMPGHSRAAIRAMEARYRRLIESNPDSAEMYRLTDPDDESEYSSAQYYTDNVICIARPSAYTFIQKIIDEFVAMHQEAGQPLTIFHVGGDEVPKGAWKKSPMCQRFMSENGLKNTNELKDYFLQQILNILRPMDIKIGGWEEIAMRGGDVNPRFAGDDVISWCWNSIPEWKGDEKPYKLANAGYPVVLACVGNLYIDMSYTNHQEERGLHWGGYTDEHSTFDFLPYDIYRSVRLTLKREQRNIDEYENNKQLSKAPRIAGHENLLLGLQGQLFAETVRSCRQVEEYIFPKLPGLAERAWNATPVSYRETELSSGIIDFETSPSAYFQYLKRARQAFEIERLQFSKQLYQYEVARIHGWGLNFHLCQPGIRVSEEVTGGAFSAQKVARMVYINHPAKDAVLRYTLDGSEPNENSPIFHMPFILKPGQTLRAKAYLFDAVSATTIYIEPEK